MAIVKTNFVVVPQGATVFTMPGDWSADQVKQAYSAQIPGLSNMVAESRVDVTPDGEVRYHSFNNRAGNKG